MFLYRSTNQYFAQIGGGLEDLGLSELKTLGAKKTRPAFRGLYFEADRETLYRINYTSRLISRVLAPLMEFKCHSTKYLYSKAMELSWKDLFSTDQTFGIFATVSNSRIRHSKYATLCLKDAIIDYFRNKFGKRPNVDTRNPDIWINLHIENNQAVVSLDTSGGPLHKRGYRKNSVEAPMQETLAAAIIQLSGWNGSQPIVDPMCGSGTLLCEALMSCCQIPSGYLRSSFGFERLPDFDPKLWKQVKSKMNSKIKKLKSGQISGNDIDTKAVNVTRQNLRNLPGGLLVSVTGKDFRLLSNLENSMIVCNPPYGVRMKNEKDLGDFYKSLGDFMKQNCRESEAYIYFGDRQWIKKVGLRTSWKKPLKNGGLDGRLVKYELY